MLNSDKQNNKPKRSFTAISAIAIATYFLITFLPISGGVFKYMSSKVSMFADVLSSVLVLQTNNFRSVNDERVLAENKLLTLAAQMKAEDMASKGYFSHISPDGKKPWYWFNVIGYKYSYAGENLAIDYTESTDVMTGWINSAKHKANLLNTNFTEIGVGVATGTYNGHETKFVVQFFGKPFSDEAVMVKKYEVLKTNLLLDSVNPEIAVVTKRNMSSGEVLGMEINSSNQVESETFTLVTKMCFGIAILALLVLLIVRSKK